MRTTTLILAAVAVSALGLAACSPEAKTDAASAVSDAGKALSTEVDSLKAKLDAATKSAADATAPHADAGPAVYFVNLHDGDTVSSPFRVVFGVYGLGVAPAGTDKPMTGHHHLLIDTELSAEEMKFAIPNDATHMHFGGGQTETVLTLPAGQHTLQLDFGDMKHEQMKPAPIMSQKITITVK
jgi:outer membrane murein-binding lipoprotein Lpp